MKETIIQYPDWTVYDGSVSFLRLNPDSLADMVIHLHGSIRRQDGEMVDTLRSICLFGQSAFDSVSVIHLDEIERFQARPFFAMELSVGTELTEPATRDLSGAISYLLEPVDLLIRDRDSVMPSPEAPLPELPSSESPIAGVDAKQGITARVYPNPADNTITIEAAGLAAGTYELQIVAADGTIALARMVTLDAMGRLARTLDVARLPNGYHFVRMENSAGKIVGSWGIVIAR